VDPVWTGNEILCPCTVVFKSGRQVRVKTRKDSMGVDIVEWLLYFRYLRNS
jgi:hypothetical protein